MTRSRFSLALLILLAACGGKSFEGPGDSRAAAGSSSQAGSGSGGQGNGGATVGGATVGGATVGGASHAGAGSGTGGSLGGSAQGGQAGDACSAFNDDVGALIGVEIVNATSDVLYLGSQEEGCAPSQLYAIEDATGQEVKGDVPCRTTCDVARKEGLISCPVICAGTQVTALAPGETYSTTWNALEYVPTTLPEVCVVPPRGANTCLRAVRIAPGEFTFSSVAARAITCSDPASMCGACEPSSGGGCTIHGALLGGKLVDAATTVLLDGRYGISAKTAPAPGDAPAPGAVALPRVQIIFK
jgi:hypothetical protein